MQGRCQQHAATRALVPHDARPGWKMDRVARPIAPRRGEWGGLSCSGNWLSIIAVSALGDRRHERTCPRSGRAAAARYHRTKSASPTRFARTPALETFIAARDAARSPAGAPPRPLAAQHPAAGAQARCTWSVLAPQRPNATQTTASARVNDCSQAPADHCRKRRNTHADRPPCWGVRARGRPFGRGPEAPWPSAGRQACMIAAEARGTSGVSSGARRAVRGGSPDSSKSPQHHTLPGTRKGPLGATTHRTQ